MQVENTQESAVSSIQRSRRTSVTHRQSNVLNEVFKIAETETSMDQLNKLMLEESFNKNVELAKTGEQSLSTATKMPETARPTIGTEMTKILSPRSNGDSILSDRQTPITVTVGSAIQPNFQFGYSNTATTNPSIIDLKN